MNYRLICCPVYKSVLVPCRKDSVYSCIKSSVISAHQTKIITFLCLIRTKYKVSRSAVLSAVTLTFGCNMPVKYDTCVLSAANVLYTYAFECTSDN